MSKAKKGACSSEEASSSSGTSSSLSSDEEVDVRDLKPIKDYLSDRRELARQLFKSVKTEKIQMMLPQTLKKMDLGQLEEWCASELSGMSKARILSVLNGKTMLESSNTSESDDSGPSLEIISDTEEWFSDVEASKKEEGKGKLKKDKVKQRGKSQPHKKSDGKPNQKKVFDNVYKNVQVKKEEEAKTNKEKEGDSLLDLLELEMRARAIRALIRKEEDIIPSTSKSIESNDTSIQNTGGKTEQDELKEKENCRRQLERIIGAQQCGVTEDEDVVLVVQPTPTIELLSSDSEEESHSGVRINKKLQNERVLETKDNVNHVNDGSLHNKQNENNVENLKENKIIENAAETHKPEVSKRIYSNNVANNDTQIKSSGKRRKVKKKSHTKEQSKNTSLKGDVHKTKSSAESQHTKSIKNDENVKLNGNEHETSSNSKMESETSLSKKRNIVKASNTLDKITLDEEKSIDLDEIIDLDDYCDDMDDIESCENDNNKNKQNTQTEQTKSQTQISSDHKTNGTETWASRYYQTDDVQNVIKESKIQSEIRKRLRERQRLSKLNTSPKSSPSSPPVPDTTNKKVIEKDPLGSVDEYLALKHTATVSLNTGNRNNDCSVVKDNGTCIKTLNDTSNVVENGHGTIIHSKEQNVHKETNLSVNANVDIQFINKNEEVVDTINNTNSG